ncbi:MAG: hypothetical protein ACUVX9_15155 [Anaerolineae bacterium]
MDRNLRLRALWLLCLAGGLVAAGLLVTSGLASGQAEARTVPGPLLTADDVLSRPRLFVQQQVVLEGEVARTLGSRVLVLRSNHPRQGLLVVLDAEAPELALPTGARVRVRGTVRLLNGGEARALERRLAWEAHQGLGMIQTQRPYVVAHNVRHVLRDCVGAPPL